MSSSAIFSGTYPCLVDDRGRLVIPKSMRTKVLPASDGTQKCWWVTVMIPERCLAVYPDDHWDQFFRTLIGDAGVPDTPEKRERLRAVLEKTYPVKLDGQGRITVDPPLLRAAGLEGPLLAIGLGDHVEYWSVAHRQEYARSMGIADPESYASYVEGACHGGESDGDER